MIKKIFLVPLSILIIFAAFLLISGNPALHYELLGIPLGTIISWLGIIAWEYSALIIVFKDKEIRTLQFILFINGVLWIAVSYALAGNFNLTFKVASRFDVWYFYTIFLIICSLFTSLYSGLKLLFKKNKKHNSN